MATRQELHLEILNQEYSRFVKDQVLTEVQLNELIDFFEDQHRLTRTCLVGTGIVCGLHLYRSGGTVTLTAGVGVTTDGDLLRPGQRTYRYFTSYTPPDNSHYDPFYYTAGSSEKRLTLYQLLTEEEKEALNSEDYRELQELDTVITNWVGILYLEYYTKDPVKCTPTNCDNLGIRQKATPKLLILSKSDMDKLIHKDAGESIGDDIYLKYHAAYDQYFTFPVIKAKRVLPTTINTLKSTTLAGAYCTAARNGAGALAGAIKKLYKAFSFLIDRGGEVNIEALAKRLTTVLANPTDTFSAQYTYDFYKDVITAYNELRDVLYNVAFECCPNLYAFPKHLMLGAANIDYGPKPPEYRHQFYPSPAVSKNKSRVNVAIGMLHRLKLLVYSFTPQLAEAVKITPSPDYDQQLAERAIPFYYKNAGQLALEWNYYKRLKGQEKLNLSYNADQYPKPVPDETLNPLDYDIDPYPFFRVEGHIGKPFQTALKELNELRAAKGVPIDLVAVRLGEAKLSDIDLDDFSCQFEDLETILRAFQAEMNCLLGEGALFFSGFTASKNEPHINLKLYKAASEELKWTISDAQLREINPLNIAAARSEVTASATERVKETAFREFPAKATASATTGTTEYLAKETLSDLLTGRKKIAIQTDICDQFNKPVFTAERVVKSTITMNEQAFGKYFLQALDTDGDSVDTFMEKARTIATTAGTLNTLDSDEKNVVFEYPMQIVGNLNYMQRFIPGSLAAVNSSLITSYRDFSQTFCKRLKAMHTRLETHFKAANYISRGYENTYLTMLNNLGRLCCGNEKLEVIMNEIEKRKKAILERLSFARFAEQHPGLEHKGGVPRGGTFVMVYAGAKSLNNPATGSSVFKAGESLLKAEELKKSTLTSTASPYRDPDTFALYIAGNEDIPDKEGELSTFLAFNNVRQGSVAAESLIRDLNTRITAISQILCRNLTQPEQDLVFADFCLPYLCCSDCPPMAFVIPRERRILALPTPITCSTSEPIPFSLYAPKGSVIGSPEAPNAIIQGEAPAFDPAKVPDAQLGKSITFTLDGEATSCVIVVRKPLVLQISATVKMIDSDAFSVTYTNTTDESLSGANSYSWSFNDGSSEVTSSTAPLVKKFSRRDLTEKTLTTISAVISVLSDPCNSTTSISVAVPAEPTTTCAELVLKMITAATLQLTSDAFKKRVEETRSAEVVEIYAAALQLFDQAREAVEKNDRDARTKLVGTTADVLRKIYDFKISSTMPEVLPGTLTRLLQELLQLMLNLVRCDKEMAAESLEAIAGNLDRFFELREKITTVYPRLDEDNVLEKFLRKYDDTFTSQNQVIKEKLKRIIEILGTLT